MILRIIRLMLILAFLPIAGQPQSSDYWVSANSPTTHLLRRMCFIDNQTGWAAGDMGTIIHTRNGGETWDVQNSGVETGIVDVFFLNNDTGWALVWSISNPTGTVILETIDGGESWTGRDYPVPNKFMKKIFFIDSLRGWMGGSPDAFVYTTDGGAEWRNVVIDSGGLAHLPVMNFSFFDSNYGFANGGVFDISGVIWKTVNGGINWFSQAVGPEPIQQIVFFDSLNALGVGGDFEYGTGIVRTSDAGQSWQYTSLGVAGVAAAVSFRTPSEGWSCLGSAQKFIFTTDSGNTWMVLPTPNNSKIFDLVFTDTLHGYAVGEAGIILKYDTTVTGIADKELTLQPSNLKLYQNYPNPFNPVTNIRFRVSDSQAGSFVELHIYDLNGKRVRTLVSERKGAGEYSVEWHGRDNADRPVSSGVYLCRLTSGADSQVRKMILVR